MNQPEEIIAELTLEEKASLCTGATVWTTAAIDRLGIPAMFLTDGPHGVRRVPDAGAIASTSLPATCFPTASCLASTWNTDALFSMGQALGEECIALNVDILLGPGVNMKRSPLGGRNFEYFSEDPFLTGEMAAALINGIQSKGVGTSLKHFAANNQETQRMLINAEIDDRALREIYLAAFETAVKKARPWTVMCAYNKLNGAYGSENHLLLTKILKEEWGFNGMVVSDWSAVHDRVASLQAGLDLEMPGPREHRVRAVVEAVQSGWLEEDLLNDSVRRILSIVKKAHVTPKSGKYDLDAHHELARQIASEGMVLLKNNGILPLPFPSRIAVIGHSAKKAHFQGGGSSHINPTKVDVPLDALIARAGESNIAFAEGYSLAEGFDQGLIDQAEEIAKTANVAVIFICLPAFKESEGYDRQDLDLTQQQIALIKAVSKVQPKTVVILNNGSPIVMNSWMGGVAAILEAWMMGQAGGTAIADILFGIVNPSGKLAETYPLRLSDTPAYINWPGGNRKVRYGEGIFIGYRYYDAIELPVMFPFGHGLSYTTFAYRNPKVSASVFRDIDGLDVSVEVTNTGKVAGKEVVQVYVSDRKSGLVRPPKELKGFAKVELKPGETKTVSLHLDFRAFAFFHPGYQKWITENGEHGILVGASSADIRCRLSVSLESTLALPCLIDKESTIRDWLEDPRAKPVIDPMMEQLLSHVRKVFGDPSLSDSSLGFNVFAMVQDMPLVSVLEFQQAFLPKPADEIVEGMVATLHSAMH
jgi:beta-glucosidase